MTIDHIYGDNYSLGAVSKVIFSAHGDSDLGIYNKLIEEGVLERYNKNVSKLPNKLIEEILQGNGPSIEQRLLLMEKKLTFLSSKEKTVAIPILSDIYWSLEVGHLAISIHDESRLLTSKALFRSGISLKKRLSSGWFEMIFEEMLSNMRDGSRVMFKSDIAQTKNTKKWADDGFPPILGYSAHDKECFYNIDFLTSIYSVPIVHQRVVQTLMDLCPHDFEALDFNIQTRNGVVSQFKLINILNKEYNMLDPDKCLFTASRSYRDRETKKTLSVKITQKELKDYYENIELGKKKYGVIDQFHFTFSYLKLNEQCLKNKDMAILAETRDPVFSQRLIDSFKKNKFKGFHYFPYEDQKNLLSGYL